MRHDRREHAVSAVIPGMQFDTTINDWHTCANTDRIYASNPCSEYMFLNDTACNLASLNLLKFRNDERRIRRGELPAGASTCRSSRRRSSSTTPATRGRRSARTATDFRPLGLGYANLGALLMSRGLPYDCDEGRDFAAAVTALMCGEAYRESAAIAGAAGPFAGYEENREPMLGVMSKHRAAVAKIDAPARPGLTSDQAASDALGRGARTRPRARIPQQPGDRAGPHRDHRVHDGLRHHRHRAGHRPRQVQEARGRRLPQDRQPHRARGARQARLRRRAGRGDRRAYIDEQGDDRGRAAPQGRAPRRLRLRVQARRTANAPSTTWATSA